MKVSIYTISNSDTHILTTKEQVKENKIPEKFVKEWYFETKPYTALIGVDLASILSQKNYNNLNVKDYAVVRGKYLAQLSIDSWNCDCVINGIKEKLPISDTNVGKLPPCVVSELGYLIEHGDQIALQEAIEAEKKVLANATDSI